MQGCENIHPIKVDKHKNNWKVKVSKSYSQSLRRVLISIISRQPNILIVNDLSSSNDLKKALAQINISSLNINPKDLVNFEKNIYSIKNGNDITELVFSGSHVNHYDLDYAKRLFKNSNIQVQHASITAGVFKTCLHARKRYGIQAVHPGKLQFVELLGVDEKGWGEIVVTKTLTVETAYIRYRTGLKGRAIREKCKCGANWIILPVSKKKQTRSLKLNSDFSINMIQ